MSDVVELTIPVRANLVVLARLTAATVASRADFDIEEIEDLRLAVDELCVSLVQGDGDGRLDLRFSHDDDQIEVTCSFRADSVETEGSSESDGAADDSLVGLSGRILDALVDEHGQDIEEGQRRAWLRKRRARTSA